MRKTFLAVVLVLAAIVAAALAVRERNSVIVQNEALVARLELLESELFEVSLRAEEAAEDAHRHKELLESAEGSLHALQASAAQTEARLSAALSEKEAALEALNAQASDHEVEIRHLRADTSILVKKNASLNAWVAQAARTETFLRQRAATAETALKASENENTTLKEELSARERTHQALCMSLMAEREARVSAEGQVSELEASAARSAAGLSLTLEEVDLLTLSIERLQVEQAETSFLLAAAQTKIAEQVAELSECRASLEEALTLMETQKTKENTVWEELTPTLSRPLEEGFP